MLDGLPSKASFGIIIGTLADHLFLRRHSYACGDWELSTAVQY